MNKYLKMIVDGWFGSCAEDRGELLRGSVLLLPVADVILGGCFIYL